jgi:hypothetical protein
VAGGRGPGADRPGRQCHNLHGCPGKADRNADASPWTALITFKADGKGAVKVLAELAETIAEAEQRLARNSGGKQVLYVHGPLPRLDYDPLHTQVWYISEELPVKHWPTSGSYFRDPLP